MSPTKNYNPGNTICTCRVGEDRYEVKRDSKVTCGTHEEECTFLNTNEDCPSGLRKLCYKHKVYFIKIQPKEQA